MKAEWELQTGQKWPVMKTPKFDEFGRFIEYETIDSQVHHIIPQNYGGPHEWWNVHPVEDVFHQGGIHGKGAPFHDLFPRKTKIQTN